MLYIISNHAPRRYTRGELLFLMRHVKANPDAEYKVSWT